MTKTKLFVYFLLIFIPNYFAFFETIHDFFYVTFIALIYYDAKDHNIRSLIVLIIFTQSINWQLDAFGYVYTKYILQTGKVAGDSLLTIIELLYYLIHVRCLYYRSEIATWACRVLGITHKPFLPTKGDLLQLNLMRYFAIIHVVFYLYSSYIAYDLITYLHLTGDIDTSARIAKEALFDSVGDYFVEVVYWLTLMRYCSFVWLMHESSKESISRFHDHKVNA